MKLPNKERIKRVLELRRSNAAQPIKSKKLYSRKRKHKNKNESWSKTACDIGHSPHKGEGAKPSLRQVPTHPENCEFYHKINLRHADV